MKVIVWKSTKSLGLLLCASIALVSYSTHAQAADQPNVLIIFSDQHRMASFPGEPYTDVIAPNLQRLAEQGIRFRNGISNYPVCSPFRGMLLTGKAPYINGIIDNNIPMTKPGDSVANAFRDNGYKTGYIGKWHIQKGANNELDEFGFDESTVWEGTNNHTKSRYWDANAGEWVSTTDYNAIGMADQAVDFLQRNSDDQFLLYVSFNPPHSNFFDAPIENRRHFRNRDLQERPNVTSELTGQYTRFANRSWNDKTHAGYLAHIEALDTQIGRVLAQLEETGHAENTIVIYTSDHGEMMLSHGRAGKRTPHEESINIPMVVTWPAKVKPARRSKTLFGAIDIAPTILSLAGIDHDFTFQGKNLADHIVNQSDPGVSYQPLMHIAKENATLGNNHPAERFRGVRTSRYTYAVLEDGPWLLFDNEKDPYQMNNLIDAAEATEEKSRLHALVKQWLAEYNDPFILKED
ncbi:MAG: sulfatase [Candidatus Hydrogenedentota bacterium]